jgi:DNA-binding NarL/FixJ family response regulator
MSAPALAPIVVILNSEPTVLAKLRRVFEQDGFTAVTAVLATFPTPDALVTFLGDQEAAVVVYDIAPPYGASWPAYQRLYTATQAVGLPLVITTVDRTALEVAVGRSGAVELDGSDASLAAAVQTVRQLLHLADSRC